MASNSPLRLLVADDHPAIIDAVARFLADRDDVELVGRCADGNEALRQIEERKPQVALLDIRMPQYGGIEILRKLEHVKDAPAVMLYTGFAERGLLLEGLDAGARAFLLKESPLTDLARAIHIVGEGGTYVDPVLAGHLAGPQATEKLKALTRREREILRLLADGMRDEQVGVALSISPLTVRTHVKNAMEKLEADTRTQAVATALRESLIA